MDETKPSKHLKKEIITLVLSKLDQAINKKIILSILLITFFTHLRRL